MLILILILMLALSKRTLTSDYTLIIKLIDFLISMLSLFAIWMVLSFLSSGNYQGFQAVEVTVIILAIIGFWMIASLVIRKKYLRHKDKKQIKL